jgi:aminoglycoside phosphotransferase (APT) family kinase protein
LRPAQLRERLADFLARSHNARAVQIEGLRLLTGGASRQTWSFDAVIDGADGTTRTLPLVLRADPRGGPSQMSRETEYRLLEAAHGAGVPVPKTHLPGDASLGMPFFIMERVEGETIARRILRDDAYAQARAALPAQLAAALARIHAIPIGASALDALPATPPGVSPAEHEVARFEQVYRALALEPHPAFELAFRWLRERAPAAERRALVHGDFRMGNVIVGAEGLRAVLDWELAHAGDPAEDLGWLCVRSWRFGNDELPAGGLATREDFRRAYEAAGGCAVDPGRARFWEAFGNLRWGIICISQARSALDRIGTGALPPGNELELAMIGRRIAETEWELLELMEEG